MSEKPYIAGLGYIQEQLKQEQEIPLIKVCRIRALENGEGKIHLQVACIWADEVVDLYFDSWEEFSKEILGCIKHLKETYE